MVRGLHGRSHSCVIVKLVDVSMTIVPEGSMFDSIRGHGVRRSRVVTVKVHG